SNKMHISFNSRNGEWLANELNIAPITTNCSYMCSSSPIIGTDIICSSSTYTVPNGASFYNWSVSQSSNLVSITGNGSPNITLTALPNASGAITLSLTMGDDGAKCGNVTLTKTIWVGKPSFTFEYTYFEPQPVKSTLCAISDVTNLTLAQQGVTNVVYTTSNNEFISNWGGPYCVRGTNVFCVNATATNACGSTTLQYDCDFGRIANNNIFKIYPNPSNDIVNIEIRDANNIPVKSATVSGELFDMMGQSKSKVEIYNNKSTFSVKGLNKGIYVLKIYIDSQIESHQIAVE
ncbi:MAG: T9SS type A sorting domain-containing protein, partial [Bacteroidia bacterium]|nr:T9SS type A sorting domain-containing protein [Bacteroidia bacterium]